MITCTIRYAETCLPCYANRFYDVAIPVDCHTTYSAVVGRIDDEFDSLNSSIDRWTDAHDVALKAAIEALRMEWIDYLDKPWDKSLPEDSGESESVYAYFSVSFEVDNG